MVFLYGNLENASSPHLQIRKIEGRKQLDGIVSSIRKQILAGYVVFIEDLTGDPFTRGAVRAMDVIEQLQDVPTELRKTHLIVFSPMEGGGQHLLLNMDGVKSEHAKLIGSLPDNHPFEMMVGVADRILNPERYRGYRKEPPPEEGPEWWPDM